MRGGLGGSLSKQITENVFDLDKVGVGDIVEFPYDVKDMLGKSLMERKAGVVLYADKYTLKVFAHEPGANTADLRRPNHIDINTIYVDDADRVRILFRSYYNAKGTEDDIYGRR